jgi:hypothetical protein
MRRAMGSFRSVTTAVSTQLRHRWVKINYCIAVASAMIGWLWLIAWFAMQFL